MNSRVAAVAPDKETAAVQARFSVFGRTALAHLDALAADDRRRSEQAWLAAALNRTIYSLNQVHGDAAIEVSRATPAPPPHPEADALFTSERGVALVIRTADCLPLFFELREIAGAGRVRIGVIHAGWRGMDARIIEKTLRRAAWPDAAELALAYAIGPCISGESYEVDADVAARFQCKQARGGGKYLVDLPAEAQLQVAAFETSLRGAGQTVKTQPLPELFADNYQEHLRYYSHRRGHAGRNLNVAFLP